MGQDLRKVVRFFIYKSLSENIQTAEKYFFKSNKLNEEDREIILKITNGDEMTFKISEAYEYFKNHLTNNNITAHEIQSLKEFYRQLKSYDTEIFPYYEFAIDKFSSDILGFWAYMRNREYCIKELKRLPSVFTRNMKSLVDIKKPQEHYYYIDDWRDKFRHLANYLDNIKSELKPEEYQILINKTFNSKVLKNKWDDIFETLQNNYVHFLEVEEPFEDVIMKAESIGAEIVDSANDDNFKFIVVRVFSPEQMREIGCGALWCLVTNATYHWDVYTHWTEFAYVIFNYKATEKKYFKMVYCEVDSQEEKDIKEHGLSMQLWAADNQTRLDDYDLEAIGVNVDEIRNQIDKAIAKKIKPKREKKIQVNKNQLNLPFEEPEYRQVAELKKIINKMIKPPLLEGGLSSSETD